MLWAYADLQVNPDDVQPRPFLDSLASDLDQAREVLLRKEHSVSEKGWQGWARAATDNHAQRAYRYIKEEDLPCVRLVDNFTRRQDGDDVYYTTAAPCILEEAVRTWELYWTAEAPELDHALWPDQLWTTVKLIDVDVLRKCARTFKQTHN